jgi:thiosulfate dehydrogenase
MSVTKRWLVVGAVSLGVAGGCRIDRAPESSAPGSQIAVLGAPVAFRVPSDTEVTDAEVLQSLRRGRALLRNTRDSLPGHVGNRLACVSCHAKDGGEKDAMPLVGVYSRFPQYRGRSGRIDLIEDRINDCFERSMNGRALDARGRDMRDLVTYMAFLSRGVPAGARVDGQGVPPIVPPLVGDTVRGGQLYVTSCSACHGADGYGTNAAPALWGPHSYNIGAGMARVRTAAAFIRAAMPQSQPGSLSPQQAFDLAAYINSRPRPDFAKKALDWPRGDPPPDVAYPTRASRAKRSD